MRVAFYAPLKAPDHPVPSGDRAIARHLLAALRQAGAARGWEVEVASRFRTYDGGGDATRQERLRRIGERVAARLVRRYRSAPADRRPRLWFTYHLYHKAPDWLGPAVSERLGIPYVVAEASHAARKAGGAWSIGHEGATRAIGRADALLALNRDDIPGVRAIAADPSRIVPFPPFLGPRVVPAEHAGCSAVDPSPADARRRNLPGGSESAVRSGAAPGLNRREARTAVVRRWGVPDDVPWLLCVAMMRGGRKLASFELLAQALSRPGLAAKRWHLVVAGDGPARRGVEAALAGRLPHGRLTFTGRVEGDTLAGLYAGSDLFVWPAVGEPMGMAMLEAQGWGLPVVAARTRGVPDLVDEGETGRLVPEGDANAFSRAVHDLLDAPGVRGRMGLAARSRVAREHSFEAATERLGELVDSLVRGHAIGEGEGCTASSRRAAPSRERRKRVARHEPATDPGPVGGPESAG